MGSWNYRVLAKEYDNEIFFEVAEVYYDDSGAPNGYCDNKGVGSEDLKGIKWTLEMMNKALEKPILWAEPKFPEIYE